MRKSSPRRVPHIAGIPSHISQNQQSKSNGENKKIIAGCSGDAGREFVFLIAGQPWVTSVIQFDFENANYFRPAISIDAEIHLIGHFSPPPPMTTQWRHPQPMPTNEIFFLFHVLQQLAHLLFMFHFSGSKKQKKWGEQKLKASTFR